MRFFILRQELTRPQGQVALLIAKGYVSYANSQFGPNGPRDFEKANGSRDLGYELSSNSTQGKIQNGPFLI